MKKQIFTRLASGLAMLLATLSFASCNGSFSSIIHSLLGRENSSEEIEVAYAIEDSQGLEFSLGDDGESYLWTGLGNCTDTHLKIPAEYNGRPVKGIGEQACCGDDLNAWHLESDSLLVDIKWGGVDQIPESMQRAARIESIWIPDSVEYIQDEGIAFCSNLKAVRIGAGLRELGSFSFNGCLNLKQIDMSEDNTAFSCVGLDLYSKDGKILYKGSSGVVLEGVEEIAYGAFYGMTLPTSMILPTSLKEIKPSAFDHCLGLETIEVQSEITAQGGDGEGVWSQFGSLMTIILNTEHIPDTMYWHGVGQLKLTSKVKSIAENAFETFKGFHIYNASTLNITQTSYGMTNEAVHICTPAWHSCDYKFYIKDNFKVYKNDNYDSGEIIYSAIKIMDSPVALPEGVTEWRYCYVPSAMNGVTIPVSVEYIDGMNLLIASSYGGSIYYKGTIEQWNAIEKTTVFGEYEITIYCSDGNCVFSS